MMLPGTYLRKRREAAGLTLTEAAVRLACLPWAIRQPTSKDVLELEMRLQDVEASGAPLSDAHAELLCNVFSFDPKIYGVLARAQSDPHAAAPRSGICRECACSWADPCVHAGRPCAWSDSAEDLCTVCEEGEAAPAGRQGESLFTLGAAA